MTDRVAKYRVAPDIRITTWRVQSKQHVVVVADASLLMVYRLVGKPLIGIHPKVTVTGGRCEGIFQMPNHQILEIHSDQEHRSTGYLFATLDAWLTHSSCRTYEPDLQAG